jgi:hypothetical protein
VQIQQYGQDVVGRPARKGYFPLAMIRLIKDRSTVGKANEQRILRYSRPPGNFATTCRIREKVDIRPGPRMRAAQWQDGGQNEQQCQHHPRIHPTPWHVMHPLLEPRTALLCLPYINRSQTSIAFIKKLHRASIRRSTGPCGKCVPVERIDRAECDASAHSSSTEPLFQLADDRPCNVPAERRGRLNPEAGPTAR